MVEIERLQAETLLISKEGAYTIIEELGAGGMGVTYKATCVENDCTVVIKTPLRDEGRERFAQEASILASLSQRVDPSKPGRCVRLLDQGLLKDEVTPFIVMEFIDGDSLLTLVTENRLTRSQKWDISILILQALEQCHAHLVVHRDLKPENILVKIENGTMLVYLIDFGLALQVEIQAEQDPRQTAPGAIMGTANYMSPEQASGLPVGPLSDLYVCGLILYFIWMEEDAIPVSIRLPEALRIARSGEKPEINTGNHALNKVISWCLESDAAQRPQTAQTVIQALTKAKKKKDGVQIPAPRTVQALPEVRQRTSMRQPREDAITTMRPHVGRTSSTQIPLRAAILLVCCSLILLGSSIMFFLSRQ